MTQGDAAEEKATFEVISGKGYQTWLMRQPPVNAINPELLAHIDAAIRAVSADSSVAAVVLASDLRVFSAGADATWMARTVKEHGSTGLLEMFNETMDEFRRLCHELRRLPVLVIAAIEGHTLAGGLELAAACDLRFSTDQEKVQFGAPEMDLFGVMPSGGGGAQYLARLLGPSRALDLILDAKPIPPSRALEIGLVDRIYPAGSVREQAESFAADVARKAGRIGVNAVKRAIFGGQELPLGPALDLDHSLHWDSMRRGNFLPGVDAFVAKFGGRAS